MLESKAKARVRDKLKKDGWLVAQMIKVSPNGWPDTQAHKDGKTIFIEMKTVNGTLKPHQKFIHKQLREQGFEVYVWTDYFVDFVEKPKRNGGQQESD